MLDEDTIRFLWFWAWVLLAAWQWRRIRRLRNQPKVPWELGSKTIDLRGGRDTIHAILGGSSGNGKSTALLPLLRLGMPVAAIGFDDSQPLQSWWSAYTGDPDYIHWTMDGTLGWNILEGPPLAVAEALTAGFELSSQDTGYFRGLARNRLMDLIVEDDEASRPRDLWRYVDMLRQGGPDSESNRACRRWAGSFETLLKTLGPSLGTDFDLTSAMRAGKKVLLLPNRFMLPESAALIGGIGLVQVRRAAAETGNFLVFIEEAGQAGNYAQEIDAMFQAGRTRGCPTILITQNISTLKQQVTNNVKAWVVFGQETKKEATASAEHLWNHPDDFLGLAPGRAWVRAPGLSSTLVKLRIAKPNPDKKRLVSESPGLVAPESFLPAKKPLALPAPTIPEWVGAWDQRQRHFRKMIRDTKPALLWRPEDGFWQGCPCLLWQGAKRDGRPAAKVDGRNATVYIETFKWAGGIIPESYEIDHLCAVPACCEPEHLEAVTTAENIRRRDGRKRALAVADARVPGFPLQGRTSVV